MPERTSQISHRRRTQQVGRGLRVWLDQPAPGEATTHRCQPAAKNRDRLDQRRSPKGDQNRGQNEGEPDRMLRVFLVRLPVETSESERIVGTG